MASIPRIKSKANDPFYDEKFHHAFSQWYSPLCNYCFFLINNYEAAEDIVQDLFVHLWENWERIKNIDYIKGYLFKSVKNRSINYLKQQSKSNWFEPVENAGNIISNVNLPDASEMIENDELEMIIDKAIEQLPSRCRTIFILKRVDEMSNKEISEQLNISIKTVEAQMTIALKRLYQFISEHWEFLLIFLVLIL